MKSAGIWEDFGSLIADTKAFMAEGGRWDQKGITSDFPESWTIQHRMDHCRQALKDMPGTALVIPESKLLNYARDDVLFKFGPSPMGSCDVDVIDDDSPLIPKRGIRHSTKGGIRHSTKGEDITGILTGAVARQRLRAAGSGCMLDMDAEFEEAGSGAGGIAPRKSVMTVPRIAFELGMQRLALLQSTAPSTPRSAGNGEQGGLDSSRSGTAKLRAANSQQQQPLLTPRCRAVPANSSTVYTPPHPSRAGMSQVNTPRGVLATANPNLYLPNPQLDSVRGEATMQSLHRTGDGLPQSARSLTGTQYSGPASRHATVPRESGPTTFRKVVSNRGGQQELPSAINTSLSGSYIEDEEEDEYFESVVAENQIDPIAQYLEEQVEFIENSDADIQSNLQQYDSYMMGRRASKRLERDPYITNTKHAEETEAPAPGPVVLASPRPTTGKDTSRAAGGGKAIVPTSPRAPFRLY